MKRIQIGNLGYFGFCRPGWLVPIYYSWKDFYISHYNGNITLTDTIKQHLDDFKEEYERLKPRTKERIMVPVAKTNVYISKTTKGKRKGEGIYTEEEDDDDDYSEDSNNFDENYRL